KSETVGETKRQSDSWSKVQLLQISSRVGIPVLAKVVELLGLQVKYSAAVINNGRWKVQRVAKAKVQRKPFCSLEVILHEEFRHLSAGLQNFALHIYAEVLHFSQQK